MAPESAKKASKGGDLVNDPEGDIVNEVAYLHAVDSSRTSQY